MSPNTLNLVAYFINMRHEGFVKFEHFLPIHFFCLWLFWCCWLDFWCYVILAWSYQGVLIIYFKGNRAFVQMPLLKKFEEWQASDEYSFEVDLILF